MNIELNVTELLTTARALRESASEAYSDERMNTAVCEFRLAGRYYGLLGNKPRSTHCFQMAKVIEQEIAAIAAGDTEEAEYLAQTTTSYARSL